MIAYPIGQQSSSTVPSCTFANLPSATVSAGQTRIVTDMNNTMWYSNGTIWVPYSDQSLLRSSIPFIVAPTGTITATTGALLLGTAISPQYLFGNTAAAALRYYMYFPANAWTGSTAGWYYVTMTSSTAGTVYSNTYTTGTPVIPTSPTLVTTGAGAYTGVTGAVIGPNFTIPANSFTNDKATLKLITQGSNSSSGGAKTIKLYTSSAGAGAGTTLLNNTTTQSASGNTMMLINTTTANPVVWGGAGAWSYSAMPTANFAIAQTVGWDMSTAVATDYVGLSFYNLMICR